MANTKRRSVLKLAGSAALVAARMAGILAAGRARLRPAEAPLGALGRLRPRVRPSSSARCAGGRQGARRRGHARDHQRQRPAAAHHRRRSSPAPAPTSSSSLHNWPHLYANAVVDVSDVAEALGKARGRLLRRLRGRPARSTASGSGACRTRSSAALIAYRKSWFDEVGATKFPEDLGRATASVAQEAQEEGQARIGQTLGHTFGDAPGFTYPLPVVLRRHGGRRRRQEGRHQLQGDASSRSSSCRRSGRTAATRAGWPGTTPTTTAPSSPASISRHAERRLDLHRRQAPAGEDQGRQGRADVHGHPARAAARGPGRASSASICRSRTRVMKYSKNQKLGQGLPEVAPQPRPTTEVVRDRRRASRVGATKKWESDPMWDKSTSR